MLLSTIIFIAIVVIAVIVLFKIFHSIIKAAVTVLLLVLVFGIIFGFFVIKDANDFNKTFKEEYSTYILAEDGVVYTGFEAKAFDFDTYSEKSLVELNEILDDDAHSGKIILISPDALDFTLPENYNMTTEDLLESEDESVRSLAFKYALFNTISEEGALFLPRHVRDKTIEILPRSLIVRTVTFTPAPLFANAKAKISAGKAKLSNLVNSNEDNVTEVEV